MGYRFHGRARVNPRSPSAFGVCDKCGFLTNLVSLTFQMEWRGNALASTGEKVCQRCYDRPNPQLRPRLVPPDPIPVLQPRPENYALANQGGGAFRGNGPIPIPVLPASTVLRPWGFAGPKHPVGG